MDWLLIIYYKYTYPSVDAKKQLIHIYNMHVPEAGSMSLQQSKVQVYA